MADEIDFQRFLVVDIRVCGQKGPTYEPACVIINQAAAYSRVWVHHKPPIRI